MTTPAPTSVPAAPAAQAAAAAPSAPPACFRKGCTFAVRHEFTWPGKTTAYACDGDAQNILSLAASQNPPMTAEQIHMKPLEQPKIVRTATINLTERGQALLNALIVHVNQTAEQMKGMVSADNPQMAEQAKAGKQFAELVGAIFTAVSTGPTPCTIDENGGVPIITTA